MANDISRGCFYFVLQRLVHQSRTITTVVSERARNQWRGRHLLPQVMVHMNASFFIHHERANIIVFVRTRTGFENFACNSGFRETITVAIIFSLCYLKTCSNDRLLLSSSFVPWTLIVWTLYCSLNTRVEILFSTKEAFSHW